MELRTFNYNNEKITTLYDDKNNVWFVASEVCRVLHHTNVTQRLKDHCESKGVRKTDILTRGGKQKLLIIDEPNLYRLIFSSKVKGAEKFQNWVFEQVIPSLRKYGKYSIPENIKKKSKKNRKILTDSWKECGIHQPHEFIQLTLQEYKSLKLDKNKRKHNMGKEEFLLFSALEIMELLSLFHIKKNRYYECKENLHKTAELIGNNIKKRVED